jgi:ABC-2 type transport system permease protein
MIKEVSLYFKCIKIHLLADLEYKGWWLMFFHAAIVVLTDPLSTILMFDRFGGIGEWTLPRILLIYSIAVFSFTIAECLFRGFDVFPWRMLRSGDFDRLLLRPKSLFSQVGSSVFHVRRLANIFAGFGILIWSVTALKIDLSAQDIIMLILALIGGTMMYAGVFVLSSGIAFFTIKSLDWIYIMTNASYQVARIPKEFMPTWLRKPFTFLMPMLVISYYPASALGGWGDSAWQGWLALPAGFVFLIVSLLIWKIGVRHYKSTGS